MDTDTGTDIDIDTGQVWSSSGSPDFFTFSYCAWLWKCLLDVLNFSLPGLEDAFAKRKYGTEVVDYGVPYDFGSIMHYPFTAFSKNGKPTIRAISSMNGKTPYVGLSADDAKQTNLMYKCNGLYRPHPTPTTFINYLLQVVLRSNDSLVVYTRNIPTLAQVFDHVSKHWERKLKNEA